MTRPRGLWFILIVAGLALFLAAAAELRMFFDVPVVNLSPPRIVYIPPRVSLREVAAILEREQVIPEPWLFVLWVRLLGLGSHLRYGEYSFGGPLTMKQIIDTLVSGKVYLHRLAIPEGFTIQQIAERAEAEGLGTAEAIARAAADPQVARRLNVPGPSLEGFCFPETYYFPRDWPPEKLLGKMTARFWEVYDDNLRRQAGARGLTTWEAVTLASIIEKEAGNQSEMPIISAVFHNRLRRDMPLMADPVIIYGLRNFDGNIRKGDLLRPGPYNVYLNKGLPPSPIANPGLPALKAALAPASVDFLFFVSKNNGSHYFSRSLAEHNLAVNLYQRGGN